MTKLEELLKEYCPEGVEYKPLGEVCDYEQPIKYIVRSTDYKDEYDIPVLTAGQSFVLGYTNEHDNVYMASKEQPVIIFDDFTTAMQWVDFNFKVKSSAMKMLKPKDEKITLLRYLYFVMKSLRSDEQKDQSTHTRQWIGRFAKLQVPVPPLVVQREIVRILDNFTLYLAELTAELTARRKQYEFYRDSLLTFDKNVQQGGANNSVQWKKLGEVAEIVRGASPRPISSYITDSQKGVNWIKIGDVPTDAKYVLSAKEKITQEGANKSRFVHKGDFILSNSMSFGRPYILKIDGCIHDGWLSISGFEDSIISDFLYYILVSSEIQNIMRKKASFGGAVQNLNADIVRNLIIPIPPLAEQERIVAILDKFDALCNDITAGLPAEIEMRKKQYEYYRDKLLTFKKRG